MHEVACSQGSAVPQVRALPHRLPSIIHMEIRTHACEETRDFKSTHTDALTHQKPVIDPVQQQQLEEQAMHTNRPILLVNCDY